MITCKKEVIAVALIMALAIVLRVVTLAGYVGLDDSEYVKIAYQVAQGTFSIGSYNGPIVFAMRPGLTYPVGFLIKVLGISEWSMVLFPFLCAVLSVPLVYVAARFLFGWRAGIISALLWAILPFDITFNTRLYPDLPEAFFASIAVVIIIVLMNINVKKGRYVFLSGLVSGLFFGLAWLCKASVILLIPCMGLFFIVSLFKGWKKAVTLWVGVSVGALSILVIESALYWFYYGDALTRFNAIEKNNTLYKDGFFTEGSRWGWPVGGSYWRAVVKRLFITGPQTIFGPIFSYLPFIGIIATAYAIFTMDGAFLYPAIWLLSLCFMFIFSSTSFKHYAPLPLFTRYLYLICYTAVVITGGFIAKILFDRDSGTEAEIKERRFWGITVAIMLLVFISWQSLSAVREARSGKGWAQEARVLTTMLTASDHLYTDSLTGRALDFLWKYPEADGVVDFEGIGGAENVPPGSYVFIHKEAIAWLALNSGMWLGKNPIYNKPLFINNIPPSWEERWHNGKAVLYLAR